MTSWSDLLTELKESGSPDSSWLNKKLQEQLVKISEHYDDAFVIFYASGFLQKTHSMASSISIAREDINGFMNALHSAGANKKLVLILHTPGGDLSAVESIVEYLRSKFRHITVIVPYLAMSGGAMISLAADELVLGRQSHLGPTDPQFSIGHKMHSARAIKEGFEQAKSEINENPKLAHLWAPILQSMGPSLVIEADKALSYGKELVEKWLYARMFKKIKSKKDRKAKSGNVAAYFNAEKVKGYGQIHVHGQRIGIEKLRKLGINVERLEKKQALQNGVLTAYHAMTLIFENSGALKFIATNHKNMWVKQEARSVAVPFHPMPSPSPPPPDSR